MSERFAVRMKAVRPHPLNVGGGRMLAAGEIADLDPDHPDVADLLSRGDLVEVVTRIVSEDGPELVDLPPGSVIAPLPSPEVPPKQS